MDTNQDYKFVIINQDLIYFLSNINDIPLHFNTTIYHTLAKTRDFTNFSMYVIEKNTNISKNTKYLVTKNDLSYFKIHKSIRSAATDINVDHSSLSKQLKNNRYKSIGGKNPGRKKKYNETILFDGFSIFKIKDFNFGKYYPKLNFEDIIILD